jgi:hypothetical protein
MKSSGFCNVGVVGVGTLRVEGCSFAAPMQL